MQAYCFHFSVVIKLIAKTISFKVQRTDDGVIQCYHSRLLSQYCTGVLHFVQVCSAPDFGCLLLLQRTGPRGHFSIFYVFSNVRPTLPNPSCLPHTSNTLRVLTVILLIVNHIAHWLQLLWNLRARCQAHLRFFSLPLQSTLLCFASALKTDTMPLAHLH